jgi:hypothetical protein
LVIAQGDAVAADDKAGIGGGQRVEETEGAGDVRAIDRVKLFIKDYRLDDRGDMGSGRPRSAAAAY